MSSTFASGGADVVYVTTGQNFPDALAAGAAAAAQDGVVLLTGRDGLPATVRSELVRLSPSRVVVVGGDGAVGAGVVAEIVSAVPDAVVTRVAGSNRYETAAQVSAGTFASGVPVVYVATGEGFADALAGSAAAGRDGGSLLLVPGRGTSVPVSVVSELQRLRPARVVILGGTAAVTDTMAGLLAAIPGMPTPERVAGTDRYDTAAKVAQACSPDGMVFVATGTNFPDALAVSAVAGARGCPIVLTAPTMVPRATGAVLSALGPRSIHVVGGVGAISRNTESLIANFLPS